MMSTPSTVCAICTIWCVDHIGAGKAPHPEAIFAPAKQIELVLGGNETARHRVETGIQSQFKQHEHRWQIITPAAGSKVARHSGRDSDPNCY